MFVRTSALPYAKPMSKPLAKILIVGGIIIALLVLWRGLYYVPNDEVDSGLQVASSTQNSLIEVSLPERLIIPKLGIDADIQHVGITKSGNMAAPNNFKDVSWYKFGTVPGARGSAVISGHEDNAISTPAIFYDLHKLVVGDEVIVTIESGERLHFKVTKTEIQPYNLSGPILDKIFNANDSHRLNLITCTGDWLPEAKTNDKRLIVYTELME